MPRSKNAVASRARRRKVLKMAKGYFGSRKNVWTVAKNSVEKATKILSWSPRLEINECLTLVADWYIQFGRNPDNLLDLTIEQIKFYESKGSLDEK